MKYQNKKNGKIVTEARVDGKTTNYILFFEDGSKTICTSSTFKRWYKALDEEPGTAEANAIEDDFEKESEEENDTCADGRKYSEIGKEIAKQAKEKAKAVKQATRTPKKKKEMESYVTEALDFIYAHVESNGDEVFKPTKDINMRAFKVGGHMYCKFNYSCSSITVAVSSKAFEGKKMVEPNKTVNHTFDNLYVFSKALTKADKDLIIKILKIAREYRIEKNNKSNK